MHRSFDDVAAALLREGDDCYMGAHACALLRARGPATDHGLPVCGDSGVARVAKEAPPSPRRSWTREACRLYRTRRRDGDNSEISTENDEKPTADRGDAEAEHAIVVTLGKQVGKAAGWYVGSRR